MSSTIRDVARLAGVSIATVSRVVNNTAAVAADKRRRVEKAVSELQYTPHPAARSLLGQETGGIGVLVPFVSGPFFSSFLDALDNSAHDNGYFLLIASSHRKSNDIASAIARMQYRVDGLIVMAPALHASTIRKLYADVPLVCVNMPIDDEDIPGIEVDNYGGAFEMTKHLLSQRMGPIAMVLGPDNSQDALERKAGFEAATYEYGIDRKDIYFIEGEFSEAFAFERVSQAWASGIRFNSLFGANDNSAVGAMMALQSHGISIPQDVIIGGFDDTTVSQYTTPQLSSVRIDTTKMGHLAIQIMMQQLGHSEGPASNRIQLPTKLVPRTSTIGMMP